MSFRHQNVKLDFPCSSTLIIAKRVYLQHFLLQNSQYQYYGAGLLSNYDKFPEHQKLIVGNRKKKKEKKFEKKMKKMKKLGMKEKRQAEENLVSFVRKLN
jgi:hypothetical protein